MLAGKLLAEDGSEYRKSSHQIHNVLGSLTEGKKIFFCLQIHLKKTIVAMVQNRILALPQSSKKLS